MKVVYECPAIHRHADGLWSRLSVQVPKVVGSNPVGHVEAVSGLVGGPLLRSLSLVSFLNSSHAPPPRSCVGQWL